MKKRKLRKKRVVKFCLIVVSLFIITIYLVNNNSVESKLKRLNYSDKAIEKIKESNKEEEILTMEYSKTLDTALSSDQFDEKNWDLYLKIDYNDDDNLIDNINKLSEIGYGEDEINKIYAKVDKTKIDYLTGYTYISDLKSYLDYEIFKPENLDRYINYKNNNENLDYKQIVLNVNMGLDKDFYDNPKIIENPDDLLVLVNKYNKLPEDYEAKDLALIDSKYSVRDMMLRKDAKESFEEMCTDAKSVNMIIKATSAYRDKEYQSNLYNNYVTTKGFEMAEKYSARPRHSEHETGLAVDVRGGETGYDLFENTEEYKWVKQNAHNYGFIIRYQKEKEYITGYNYESWHLRYVGKDVATYIYENDITFDEYYALFLDK